jgi:hypothetical protein
MGGQNPAFPAPLSSEMGAAENETRVDSTAGRNRLLWSPAGEVRTLADAPAPRQGESDFCRKYSYLKGNSYLKGRRL